MDSSGWKAITVMAAIHLEESHFSHLSEMGLIAAMAFQPLLYTQSILNLTLRLPIKTYLPFNLYS